VALYEGISICPACGQPADKEATQAVPRNVAYAGFWLRAVAQVIDWFVLLIPTFAMVSLAMTFLGVEVPSPEETASGALPPARVFIPMEVAFVVLQWLYYAFMESSHWQGTLGKRALGIGVSDLQGRRISFGRASGRFFGKIVSNLTFLVGYVLAAFTERRQALHDILAGCLVVKMP
jgi:uncharacterized RDD family membrane protein YckC